MATTTAQNIALSPEVCAQAQYNETEQDTQRVFAGLQRLKSLTPLHDKDEAPFLYVANYEYGGWSLVAADTHMQPLLAFSEHGSFNVAELIADGTLSVTVERNQQAPTMPEGLLDWLQTTHEIVQALRENPGENNVAAGAADCWRALYNDPCPIGDLLRGGGSGAGWKSPCPPGGSSPGGGPGGSGGSTYNYAVVSPLLHTNWGQGCTYNDYCPNFSNSDCNHAPTGCVATAMAQVMYYHQHNSTAYTYNWSAMPFGVNANASRDGSFGNSGRFPEVARLIHDCGASVGMSYGSTTSGANPSNVPAAFKGLYSSANSFGYSSANYVTGNALDPQDNRQS